LIHVGADFEDEYPDASALATECYANFLRTGDLLMELHNRQTREQYGLSPHARQILAVVEGAGEPLEPSVIADRLLTTTGTMTSLLDTLEKRGLIERLPHPDDRRKRLVQITPDARTIVDALLPSLHARERAVMSDAFSTSEKRQLLELLAKLQQAALRASSEPPVSDARRVRPGSHPTEGSGT
jgi:DNA-binding MarR family transcriptional regulator